MKKAVVKQSTIDRKIKQIKETVYQNAFGVVGALSIEWCIDTLAWLWKFKHISKEQFDELCDLIISYQEGTLE